jgi:hypothetical protein
MPKHIRHGAWDDFKKAASETADNARDYINKATAPKEGYRGRMEEDPKIMGLTKKQIAIIAVILFILLAHCMGWITLPACIADMLPRKSAPASHLQYFFF